MTVYAGTSGYAYKEWKGTFYPADLPNDAMLGHYAGRLPTVKITHFGRLKNVDSELGYFLQVSQALGSKRGPSLFQLPPNFKLDLERLTTFLAAIPRDWRAAMEFRHASWFTPDVYTALRDRNVALCIADHGGEDAATPFEPTADWGYLRLRREGYTPEELQEWMGRIRDAGWNDAFVFFKHEDGAVGPAMAERFLSLAG